MKKVLFAISHSFPYGLAYAARIRSLCKLFQLIGFETVVLCDYPSEGSNLEEYGKIQSVSDKPYKGIIKLFKLPLDYEKKLNSLLKENNFDYVISRSMFDRFDRVLKTVKRYKIPLILESCEWYDVQGFARKKLDIRYWQFQHCFKHSFNAVDGVIAISNLLETHYLNHVKNVIRIPVVLEVDKLPYRIETVYKNRISLLFSGNIYGGKEQFEDLIIALSKITRDNIDVILNIYGTSKEELEHSLNQNGRKALSLIRNSVFFHGIVPQSDMAVICANNDFGVFFRPDRRSSHAGFPTKLAEFLSAGTPVITNDTGDISNILVNGENGYLLKSADSNEILKILKQCSKLSEKKYRQMRTNARNSAEKLLDYSVYSESLIKFLDDLN